MTTAHLFSVSRKDESIAETVLLARGRRKGSGPQGIIIFAARSRRPRASTTPASLTIFGRGWLSALASPTWHPRLGIPDLASTQLLAIGNWQPAALPLLPPLCDFRNARCPVSFSALRTIPPDQVQVHRLTEVIRP